jgi:hypothetical protein
MYSVELDAVLFDSSLLLCFTSVLLLLQVFHPAYFPVSSISGFFAMVSHNSHKRNRVALLHAKGLSAYMIHRELKQEQCVVPIRTIQRWCSALDKDQDAFLSGRRYKRTGNPKRGRNGAAPLSVHDKQRLRARCLEFPETPYRKLAAELPADLKASPSTLQREATKDGQHSFHRDKKPALTKANKRKRRAYAKAVLAYNWGSVVPIDEFTCDPDGSINLHNRRFRAKKKDDVPPIGVSKWGFAETRMAILSPVRLIPLIKIKANATAEEFQKVMEKVIPMIDDAMGEEYCILHDNAPGWAAKSTQDYLAERVPAFFDKDLYPGNSGDCNPAERAIGYLKEAISKRKIHSREELNTALDEEWPKVASPERVRKLLEAVPDTLREIIRLRGGMTKNKR